MTNLKIVSLQLDDTIMGYIYNLCKLESETNSTNFVPTQMWFYNFLFILEGTYEATFNNVESVEDGLLRTMLDKNFEKWDLGPVYRPAREKFSKFKRDSILKENTYDEDLNFYKNQIEKHSYEGIFLIKIIDYLFDKIKNIDIRKLSNWTHANNSPWDLANKLNYPEIPKTFVFHYFKNQPWTNLNTVLK